MNIFTKSPLILLLLTLFGFASSGENNTEQTFELIDRHGQKTVYTLQPDEFALTQQKKELSNTIEMAKKIKDYPAYTLFAVRKRNIVPKDTQKTLKKGNVYYKYGQKDDDHRYISTGQVIVVFNPGYMTDLHAFAKEHNMTYIKTLSKTKERTVLFANDSEKNEIELSSTLIHLPEVKTAKPNWILPVRLF